MTEARVSEAVPAAAKHADGAIWRWLTSGLPARVRKPSSADHLRATLELARLLAGESGEAQAVRLAERLADAVRDLDDAGLAAFFAALVDEFGPDEAALLEAARVYAEHPDQRRAVVLHGASEPRRQELLRRLNMAPGGTALIVRLREAVLRMVRTQPDLAPLEAGMRQLLASWFNRGFLQLGQIGWDSPAALLENVIRYEAVHEIGDWISLRSRLQGNRRCLGFFHPAMPGIPLIFVEVALTMEMSAAVTPLLAEAGAEAPLARPTNAIFYSINNCHPGLKGINLGDLLIKQVVQELRREFPSLRHFATLSPIPGFAAWLAAAGQVPGRVPQLVAEALATEGWQGDTERCAAVRAPLLMLCAEYLTGRKPDGGAGRATDPVARFHLANGARLERINWLADLSSRGLRQSHGLMVNYRYLPDSIDANHRAFVDEGRIAKAPAVTQMLEGGARLPVRLRLQPMGFGRRAFRNPDSDRP